VAIQTNDIAILTTDQIVALATARIPNLTTAQIAGLTSNQLNNFTTVGINALTTAQIAKIETNDVETTTRKPKGHRPKKESKDDLLQKVNCEKCDKVISLHNKKYTHKKWGAKNVQLYVLLRNPYYDKAVALYKSRGFKVDTQFVSEYGDRIRMTYSFL
jgi:hypothetical protein